MINTKKVALIIGYTMFCQFLIIANFLWSVETIIRISTDRIEVMNKNYELIMQKKSEEYDRMQKLEWIDTESIEFPILNDSKITEFLLRQYPQSPLIDDTKTFFIEGYKKGFTDQEIILLIAIAGTESGFTKNSYHNYWGIMCTRNGKTSTNCGWESDSYAISRAYDLVGSYLKRWDGTHQGLKDTFIGSYCQSSCKDWVSSTIYFYEHLI